MSQFDQTLWADAAYAREFLDHADHYIPERHQLFAVMRSFYRRFILPGGQGKVCDLRKIGLSGCDLHAASRVWRREGLSNEWNEGSVKNDVLWLV